MFESKRDLQERKESRKLATETHDAVIRIDERLKFVEEKPCPYGGVIEEIRRYNKDQNGHIADLATQGAQTQTSLLELKNMKKGKIQFLKDMGAVTLILIGIITLVLKIIGVI
ncbi:MAG: hypothetical protein HOG49_30505 [Candidatus Scalindua sp.]|jgi:hypothetical protein|nr:hypothetical protein [Candidatus Scalindua sp.]